MMTDTTVTQQSDRRGGAPPFQQDARRDAAGQYRPGRAAEVDGRGSGLRQGGAEGWCAGAKRACANEARKLWPPVANPESGALRRHRRGVLGGADRDAALSRPTFPTCPGHHWSNAMAMATPIAHKGIVAGSKVMAMTVVDLMLRPELIAQAKDYFHNVQLKNNRYEPLLPDSARAADPYQSRDHGALPAGDAASSITTRRSTTPIWNSWA